MNDPVRVIERRTLEELTGDGKDVHAVSDLGYARYEHQYPAGLLAEILSEARRLATTEWEAQSADRHLGLRHLRAAHERIPAIKELMYSRERLSMLGELARAELEPYPITRAASHINFYRPRELPIDFHADGAAMVELIPLHTSGSAAGGSTVVYRGTVEDGQWILSHRGCLPDGSCLRIPQRGGHGVLMQGRRLLHSAEEMADGERITLVLVLRAAQEPWKDGNTLARLLQDDPLGAVHDEWVRDQQYQADRYRHATRKHDLQEGMS